MKKIKLFFMALLSLLLPSCTPAPTQENNSVHDNIDNDKNVSLENENQQAARLSNLVKFPASSENSSMPNPNAISSNSGELVSGDGIASDTENTTNDNLESNESSYNQSMELLSTFSTKVYTKTSDRQKNLRIVCEKLSGSILAPNEEFSYNATCGPYNKENGFGKATIFVGKQEKQEYGGGVCQLSSTLYNAVKDLNVKIVERHNHSKKVYYVPDGQDATVSYDSLDFKFKNLNDYSLYFEATSNAESVTVNVYKSN